MHLEVCEPSLVHLLASDLYCYPALLLLFFEGGRRGKLKLRNRPLYSGIVPDSYSYNSYVVTFSLFTLVSVFVN